MISFWVIRWDTPEVKGQWTWSNIYECPMVLNFGRNISAHADGGMKGVHPCAQLNENPPRGSWDSCTDGRTDNPKT